MADEPIFLDAAAAAEWLQRHYGICTVRSLAKHRHYGTGPAYRKLGPAVRYTLSDLRAWAEGRMSTRVFTGTAEYSNNAA